MLIRILSLALLLIAAAVGYWHIQSQPIWAPFHVPYSILRTEMPASALVESSFIPSSENEPEVHAASIITLNDGNVRAFWFAGSREGAKDIVIRTAVYNSVNRTWGEPTIVTDRLSIEKGLKRYIKKLGNPVPIRTADGKLHVLFVTASIGGWATSSISSLTSNDEGNTWSHPQRLITSPFLNLSTLVKSPSVSFLDGSLGLPVYHELFGKMGELLRLESSERGLRVLNKRRMSDDHHSLQPLIFTDTPQHAIAYFRQARDASAPQRIPTSVTFNAGYTWEMSNDLPLPNPNSAIAGLTLGDGDRLLVFNDLEDKRYRLVMAISHALYLEGKLYYTDWHIMHTFEDDSTVAPEQRGKYAYPFLTLDHAGNVHVVYTWKQEKIKHVFFSADYFARLKEKQHELH